MMEKVEYTMNAIDVHSALYAGNIWRGKILPNLNNSNGQIFTRQNIVVDEIRKPQNFRFFPIIIMSRILQYFHYTNNSSRKDSDKDESSLPGPNGELSKKIPSSSITVANAIVNEVLEKPRRKHGFSTCSHI